MNSNFSKSLAGLLSLLVLLAGLAVPLLEHGHGLDDAHHHGCSACRLADAGAGAEAPERARLGIPSLQATLAPIAPHITPAPRTTPDPLRPRAPPVA